MSLNQSSLGISSFDGAFVVVMIQEVVNPIEVMGDSEGFFPGDALMEVFPLAMHEQSSSVPRCIESVSEFPVIDAKNHGNVMDSARPFCIWSFCSVFQADVRCRRIFRILVKSEPKMILVR